MLWGARKGEDSTSATYSSLRHGPVDPVCLRLAVSAGSILGPSAVLRGVGVAAQPQGSCGVDLHDVVVGGGQHQDLLRVAVVEHLSGAERLQAGHGHTSLLLVVTAAHRVHAASATDARCVCLVVQGLVQQGQAVVLHAAVCESTQNPRVRECLKCGTSQEVLPTHQQVASFVTNCKQRAK